MVNLGEFPSNQPPTLALAASATVVPVNVPVTFTATASDPDGDVLAYAWQHFGDSELPVGVAPTRAVITRSFSSSGHLRGHLHGLRHERRHRARATP